MQATIRTVNATGLAEIRAILAQYHKLGGDHFTDSMIHAWAAEAQFQLDEGNPASIEIKARDHVNGYAQDFQLSDASVDVRKLSIEETAQMTGADQADIDTELEAAFSEAVGAETYQQLIHEKWIPFAGVSHLRLPFYEAVDREVIAAREFLSQR